MMITVTFSITFDQRQSDVIPVAGRERCWFAMALAAAAPAQSAALTVGGAGLPPPPPGALGTANLNTVSAALNYERSVKRRYSEGIATENDQGAAFVYAVEVAVDASIVLSAGGGLPVGFGAAVAAAVGPLIAPAVAPLLAPINASLDRMEARIAQAEARRINTRVQKVVPVQAFVAFPKVHMGFDVGAPAAWAVANIGALPPPGVFPQGDDRITVMSVAAIRNLQRWYNDPALTGALPAALPANLGLARNAVRRWVTE